MCGNSVQTIPNAVKTGNHIFLNFKSADEWGTEIQAFQVLDFDLNPIGDPSGTFIYPNPFGMNQPFAKVVTGDDGHVYIAFSDIRSWDLDIYLQKYDELGNQQWEDGGVLITDAANDDIVESIESLPGGGCIVFWSGGAWNDLNAYCQAINGEGASPEGWPSGPLNLSTGPGYQLDIKTAALPNGVFSIWKDTRNDNADIYGQLINFDGSIAGTENGFVITNEENDQNKPTINMNNVQNEVLICWEDFANGTDFDLVCKSFDPLTLSEGEEIIIAGEAGNQTAPYVSVSQNGSYLIAWEDTRSGGTSDIYMQKMNASGAIFDIGGIPVCSADFDQRNPGTALYSEIDNAYLLFWEDLRSSGKEFLWNIYAQSISLSATPTIVVDYLEAWNIVSLPLSVSDPSQSAAFPNSVNGTLYGFDGSYYNASELTAGHGYWLYFESADANLFTGTNIDNVTLTLIEGWNLMGTISEEVAIGNIIDPSGIIVEGTIYGFSGSYENASVLSPGKGYWINASSPGEITLSNSTNSKIVAGTTFADLSMGMSELIFNNMSTLYFGKDIAKEKKESFRLPPKPPSGAFDIRFQGNWKLPEESYVIEVMNTEDRLSVQYIIKNVLGVDEHWKLTDSNGKEYILNDSGEFSVSGNISYFILSKTNSGIPLSFSLSQNYPNPFNPITRITYSIPKESQVTISIFNLLGQKIVDLVSQNVVPGEYSIAWDGTNHSGEAVPSGIYIYSIEADEFQSSKKMVLMK